jgi:hypothetical protein
MTILVRELEAMSMWEGWLVSLSVALRDSAFGWFS